MDSIIVEVATDAGNLGMGVAQKFSINFGSGNATSITQQINEGAMVRISVSPNPLQDVLTVNYQTKESTNYKLIISTLDGKKVKDLAGGTISANMRMEKVINVSDLANGIYFVQFINSNGDRYSKKFIKQ